MDRSLGSKQVPSALVALAALDGLGENVVRFKEHFSIHEREPEESDAPWIQLVGENGWIGLSTDLVTLPAGPNVEKMREFRSRIFQFTGGNKPGAWKVRSVVTAIPLIREFVATNGAGGCLVRVLSPSNPPAKRLRTIHDFAA